MSGWLSLRGPFGGRRGQVPQLQRGGARAEHNLRRGAQGKLEEDPGLLDSPLGGFTGKCPENGRGSVGASPSPFPRNSQERTRGCVSRPSASRCGCTEGSRGLDQPGPAWERQQRETSGCPGKGGRGETSRPSARKELPLSGKDFDARAHPFTPPSPVPCTPASGGPSPVLWKALGEEAAA